jgi:hypothetical protein
VAHDRGGYVGHFDGPLTAEGLLAWFDEIALGKSFKERREGELAKKSPQDTFRRLQLASTLQRAGSLDAATAEYVWLWEHMLEHDPKMALIRHSTSRLFLKKSVYLREPLERMRRGSRYPSASGVLREPVHSGYAVRLEVCMRCSTKSTKQRGRWGESEARAVLAALDESGVTMTGFAGRHGHSVRCDLFAQEAWHVRRVLRDRFRR